MRQRVVSLFPSQGSRTFVARDLVLDWVVQRLDELEERRVQRGEKLCRLQQETRCGSAMRFQSSPYGRGVQSRRGALTRRRRSGRNHVDHRG
jgi:hypothetical protein